MASASWLFAQEIDASEGEVGVARLRDALGRRWPVLDAVCAGWLDGARLPPVRTEGVLPHFRGLTRLVIVGLESRWLDRLLDCIGPELQIGILRHSEFTPDWERVQSNLGERITFLELSSFQSWAGSRSALLSFVYGAESGKSLFATSSWVRVSGPDTRTQFRDLIGWDVLGVPLSVYPRWLVAVPREQFTHLEAGV